MSPAILFHFLCAQHVSDINVSITAQLQPTKRTPTKTSRTKSPTHNELRTNDRCGNSTTQSQAADDGYINVRNMLST